MGRSSKSQAQDNRARIVEAASGLFRAQGIDAVGIADVMRAAGMTQGGFYRHFDSKEALAAEACALAFERAAATWTAVAQTARAQGRDPAKAVVDYYLTPRPPERTCAIIALGPDASRRPPGDPLRDAYRDGVDGLMAVFEGLTDGDARAEFAAMVGAAVLGRAQ